MTDLTEKQKEVKKGLEKNYEEHLEVSFNSLICNAITGGGLSPQDSIMLIAYGVDKFGITLEVLDRVHSKLRDSYHVPIDPMQGSLNFEGVK